MAEIKKKKEKKEIVVVDNTPTMFSEMNKVFFDAKEVDQAVLLLTSEITSDSCGEIMAEIIELNFAQTNQRPKVINLMITSIGGDMDAAIALINVIRGSTIPVRTIACGRCASAALCILMSGHQRCVTPWTSLLSHQFSTGMEGTFSNLQNAAEEFTSYYKKMVDIYTTFTNIPRDRVEAELLNHRDVFLTPEEAVRYNIADTVIDLK